LSKEGTTLGLPLAASLPDPTSVEDEVVNELYYEHALQQIRTWNFLQDEELEWFTETYAAKQPFDSVGAKFDTPAREVARVRQRKSRARQKALTRLESIVGWYFNSLIDHSRSNPEDSGFNFLVAGYSTRPVGLPKEVAEWFILTGDGRIHFVPPPENLLDSWLWGWAQQAVCRGASNKEVIYENPRVIVRSLTHRFDGSPGHIFFMSPQKEKMKYTHNIVNELGCSFMDDMVFSWVSRDRLVKDRKVPVFGLPNLDQAVNEVVKANNTPTIIYDPCSVICWDSILHCKLGAYCKFGAH
jgi:hypothetical protein